MADTSDHALALQLQQQEADSARSKLDKYLHYFNRWNAHQLSRQHEEKAVATAVLQATEQLDALTADRRLAALSNMLAFEHNLNATCLRSAGYTPPRLIVREESPKVNGLKVDGLREVLEQHWAASVRELNHFYNKGKAKARRPHGQTERFLKNATRTGSNRGRSLRGHRRHADRDSSWGAWFAG